MGVLVLIDLPPHVFFVGRAIDPSQRLATLKASPAIDQGESEIGLGVCGVPVLLVLLWLKPREGLRHTARGPVQHEDQVRPDEKDGVGKRSLSSFHTVKVPGRGILRKLGIQLPGELEHTGHIHGAEVVAEGVVLDGWVGFEPTEGGAWRQGVDTLDNVQSVVKD